MLVSVVSKQQEIAKDGSYFSRDMTEDINSIRRIILLGAVYGSALGDVSEDLLSSIQPQLSIVLTSVLEKVHEKLLVVPAEENIAVPQVDGGLDLIPVDIYGLLAKIPLLGGQKSQLILSFFSNQLAEAIKFSPNLTINQAFQKQNEWTCSKSPQYLCQLLQSLLIPFDAKDALDLMKKVMLKGNFNWRIMLTLMSVFITNKENAGPVMKEYLASLLQEGFAKSCSDTIKLALLIARQCGSEGKNFPSYAEWFSSMFGPKGGAKKIEGNVDVILNSMSNFKLLMTVITDLVPVESISGLRAHMSCPPQVLTSSNVRAMISDYLHLARTRLSDFGVTQGEQGGLFQAKLIGKQEAASSSSNLVETEIEAVMTHFEKTRNLLPALLNASLPLPDTLDTKMKVIETLHSKGLISASMLENYLKTCKEFGRT
ncbi:hypothetical protein J437_LFUL010332 [Ladona fulva]|uniref:Fanconi anaemia group A protein N-terminal domain-containing protein n=1 Tax=Ladona fulva TaxID=123851 RepID=A0A8K0JZS0_LADFU|nr:hypothetical protein J437_LFUL010332 [Ladona fulva]